MKYIINRPDQAAMEQILAQEPFSPTGAILRLAWLQGLAREEIARLTWMDVDFLDRAVVLKTRSVPLAEETAACLQRRLELYGARSPFVVISDKYKKELSPESISRLARAALDRGGQSGIRLTDLRHDFFLRQLEEHDWPYAIRICGLSVSTFQTCFAGGQEREKHPPQEQKQVDEFKLWKILQAEKNSAVGLVLWMTWQMGLQARELVALTWADVDLAGGTVGLPDRKVPMTNAVRRLLEKELGERKEGDDPHVIVSPQSRKPMDVPRLSKLARTALIRGGMETMTLRDIRAAGERKGEDALILERARTQGSIARRDVMELLHLSDTAAYMRLHALAERRELVQIGRKYYLSGTVVPPEKQRDAICAYLKESGSAYCQDIAEMLHIGKRKCASILKRLVEQGELLQFEKRYYLAEPDRHRQVQ